MDIPGMSAKFFDVCIHKYADLNRQWLHMQVDMQCNTIAMFC